jgi:hypothetical protein
MGLLRRYQVWRDNSYWHHRLVANGPFWWVCGDCRALRRLP